MLNHSNGNPDTGTEEQSNTPLSETDMCPLTEWPSHARRYRPKLQEGMAILFTFLSSFLTIYTTQYMNSLCMFWAVGADGPKKKGRGVVKGLKVAKKRFLPMDLQS